MENILVYATPYKATENKWGYKWIGFYNGKRFLILQNPDTTEMMLNEIENKYIYSTKEQEELLPEDLRKLSYQSPLSNHYFLYGNDREITIEVVMQLIEKGYNISKITMEQYSKYCNGNEEFLCRYIYNGNVIITILKDKSIRWEE